MSLDGISLLNLLSSGALTWGSLHTLAYSSYHAYEKRGTPPALVWGIKALVCLGFALQSNTSVAVYYQYLGPACELSKRRLEARGLVLTTDCVGTGYGVGKVNTISFHVAMICVGMVLCSRLGSMMGWGKVATKIFLVSSDRWRLFTLQQKRGLYLHWTTFSIITVTTYPTTHRYCLLRYIRNI